MKSDKQLALEAKDFIKFKRKEFIKKFIDPEKHVSVGHPISLFMAGSPGAGKTEVSQRLIEQFKEGPPLRIDADEIRKFFPKYNGSNSHIFQSACTIGVNKLFNYVLKERINVILDGTFAYNGALDNIQRSVNHKRIVIIWYLFQDPEIAWKFTKIREIEEGRRVPKDVFIKAFIEARENVNKAKDKFGSNVILNLAIKDFIKNTERTYLNIENIDKYLEKIYTINELESILL